LKREEDVTGGREGNLSLAGFTSEEAGLGGASEGGIAIEEEGSGNGESQDPIDLL